MSGITRPNELLDPVARVLLRCWVFGFLFVTFWFALYMLAGDAIYRLHGSMFGLGKHELDVISYCGMGLVKLDVILFFFFPWLAIRLVLRKSRN